MGEVTQLIIKLKWTDKAARVSKVIATGVLKKLEHLDLRQTGLATPA